MKAKGTLGPVEFVTREKKIRPASEQAHVAKLHDMAELDAMKPFLREAYEYSVSS